MEEAYAVQHIDYEPFGSQQDFHDLSERFKGFSGPVGSGKSAALVAEALSLAYDNPGRMGLIGAPTYPMLRDTTRLAFLDLLERNAVPFQFNKAENYIDLPECESHIIFRTLDNPTRLVGTNLAWFGVDELTYSKEDAWNRLEARLRDPRAKRLCGFAVWTPKGFDWVYKRFVAPETRVNGYAAIFAKPRENTALPADFYERLKHSYDERFYLQEVEGQYLNIFSGRCYYAFDRGLNCEIVDFDRRHALCWAQDFNVNPMASVICQIIDGRVRVLEEIILPDSHTLAACEEFEQRAEKYQQSLLDTPYGRAKLNIVVYGDPAGSQRSTTSSSGADRTDWRIVRQWASRNSDKFNVSFRVASSHPTHKARVNETNGMLLNHAGERRLVVHPRCKELIADYEQVAWKEGGSTQIDKDKDSKRTHVSDALGYMISKEFPLSQKNQERSDYLGF